MSIRPMGPSQAGLAGAYVAKAGTRTAFVALSNTSQVGTVKLAEVSWRQAFVVPRKTTRWRLRVRNYVLLTEAAVLNGASFAPVWLGKQAVDSTGTPTASFTATPTNVLPAFTLPADGSEYVSGWVTDSTMQIDALSVYMLALAYTGGDTGTGQASGATEMWYAAGAGVAANVGTTSGGGGFSRNNNSIFDVRIEYDTLTSDPVVLGIGDSILNGLVSGSSGMPSHKAAIVQYGKRTGAVPINAGVASSKLSEWGDTTKWKYARFTTNTAATFDVAFIQAVTNDVAAAASLASLQASFVAAVASLRSLGVTAIYGVTCIPRAYAHTRLRENAAAAATSITTADTVANGTWVIGEGATKESVTVSAVSGTGPYTVTTSALASAHKIGETVAGTLEAVRLSYNEWLRGLPSGIQGVVSYDRAISATYDRSIMQPEFDSGDSTHPSQAGQNVLAEVLPYVTTNGLDRLR